MEFSIRNRLVHSKVDFEFSLEDREEMTNLYQAIDRMKRRFGSEAVLRGVAV